MISRGYFPSIFRSFVSVLALFACLQIPGFGASSAEAMPLALADDTAKTADSTGTYHASVLLYHRVERNAKGDSKAMRANTVEPDVFAAQMDYLVGHGFSVVPYGALVDCLLGHAALPPKAVVITLDDGWPSQYQKAFPILRARGLTATFFIVTDSVSHYGLTWDQVREMDVAGMTVASHTKSHRRLTILSDEALREELVESKSKIEAELGHEVKFIAHPFGSRNDRVDAAVRDAGYVSARGVLQGVEHRPSDRYDVHVVLVGNNPLQFAKLK